MTLAINISYDDPTALAQAAFTAGAAPVAQNVLEHQLDSQEQRQREQYGLYSKYLDQQAAGDRQDNLFNQQNSLLNTRLQSADERLNERFSHQSLMQKQAQVDKLRNADHQNELKIQSNKESFDNRQSSIRGQVQQDIDHLEQQLPALNPADAGDAQRIDDIQTNLTQLYAKKLGIRGKPYRPPPPKDPQVESQYHKWYDPISGENGIGYPPPGRTHVQTWGWSGKNGMWEVEQRDQKAANTDIPADYKVAFEKAKLQATEWDRLEEHTRKDQQHYTAMLNAQYTQAMKHQKEAAALSAGPDGKVSFDYDAMSKKAWAEAHANLDAMGIVKPTPIDPANRPQLPNVEDFRHQQPVNQPPAAVPPNGPLPPAPEDSAPTPGDLPQGTGTDTPSLPPPQVPSATPKLGSIDAPKPVFSHSEAAEGEWILYKGKKYLKHNGKYYTEAEVNGK